MQRLPRAHIQGWRPYLARGMSIMERYRKVRPVPQQAPQPWARPPEFAGGRDGTEHGENVKVPVEEDVSELLRPRRPLTYVRSPVPSEAQFRTWDPPVQPVDPHLLRIGLIGPPNAGKSSIMNEILNCHISAVSPKVNTTREGIRGVKTIGNTQLVFLDVPGIIPSHQRESNKELVAKAWTGYQECDLCLLVIDVVRRPTAEVFEVVRKICPKEDIGEAALRRRMKLLMEVDEDGRKELPPRAMELLPRTIPGTNAFSLKDEDRPPVTLVLNKIDKASEMRWAVELSRRFYSCLPVDPW